MNRIAAVLLGLSPSLLAEGARADQLRVPADFPSIAEAIAAANSGDEIVIADGVYTGQNNRNLGWFNRDITVRSENGPATCIIDAEYQGRGFFFDNDGSPLRGVIEGLTIRRGYADDASPRGPAGGGAYVAARRLFRTW